MLIVIFLHNFFLLLTSLLDSIVKFVNRGKCQNLIKYQGKTFEFKGLTAEILDAKISLGEFSTEIKNIGTEN
jgi:hypothetical protein